MLLLPLLPVGELKIDQQEEEHGESMRNVAGTYD